VPLLKTTENNPEDRPWCDSFSLQFASQASAVSPAERRRLIPQPAQAIGGEVLLELVVDAQGVVRGVQTLRATPPFTLLSSTRCALGTCARHDRQSERKPRAMESSVLVAGVFATMITTSQPNSPRISRSSIAPFRRNHRSCHPLQGFDGIVLGDGVTPNGPCRRPRSSALERVEQVSLEAVRGWRFTPTKTLSYACGFGSAGYCELSIHGAWLALGLVLCMVPGAGCLVLCWVRRAT
jgi:hypothetical protein